MINQIQQQQQQMSNNSTRPPPTTPLNIAQCTDLILQKLFETGQIFWLRRYLSNRMIRHGWSSNLRWLVIDYIKTNGPDTTNISHMWSDLGKISFDSTPQQVKQDLRAYLHGFAHTYIEVDDNIVELPPEVAEDKKLYQIQSRDEVPEPPSGLYPPSSNCIWNGSSNSSSYIDYVQNLRPPWMFVYDGNRSPTSPASSSSITIAPPFFNSYQNGGGGGSETGDSSDAAPAHLYNDNSNNSFSSSNYDSPGSHSVNSPPPPPSASVPLPSSSSIVDGGLIPHSQDLLSIDNVDDESAALLLAEQFQDDVPSSPTTTITTTSNYESSAGGAGANTGKPTKKLTARERERERKKRLEKARLVREKLQMEKIRAASVNLVVSLSSGAVATSGHLPFIDDRLSCSGLVVAPTNFGRPAADISPQDGDTTTPTTTTTSIATTTTTTTTGTTTIGSSTGGKEKSTKKDKPEPLVTTTTTEEPRKGGKIATVAANTATPATAAGSGIPTAPVLSPQLATPLRQLKLDKKSLGSPTGSTSSSGSCKLSPQPSTVTTTSASSPPPPPPSSSGGTERSNSNSKKLAALRKTEIIEEEEEELMDV